MADHPAIMALTRMRLPGGPEKDVQAAIGAAFDLASIAHHREVHLAPGDIIDFLAGDVGIEVKIKGPRRAILRQLERYAESPKVRSLVLVSSIAMGLPPSIKGKPVDLVVVEMLGLKASQSAGLVDPLTAGSTETHSDDSRIKKLAKSYLEKAP